MCLTYPSSHYRIVTSSVPMVSSVEAFRRELDA